jgi:hypothetical protein
MNTFFISEMSQSMGVVLWTLSGSVFYSDLDSAFEF